MSQNPFYDNPVYQVDLKQHQVQQDDVHEVHGGGGLGSHGGGGLRVQKMVREPMVRVA